MSDFLPIAWQDKVNSPELLAFLQQYGAEHYLSAEEINQLRDGVNELFELIGSDSRPYKVFTALLSQNGGNDSQPQTDGTVYEGITYLVDGPSSDADFTNVGGKLSSVYAGNYYFIATATEIPNNYGGATLQYNIGAPVVIVLENTIGEITFTYANIGDYRVSSPTLFITNKTTVFITNPNSGILGVAVFVNDQDNIYIKSFNTNDGERVDGWIQNCTFEIRVYN